MVSPPSVDRIVVTPKDGTITFIGGTVQFTATVYGSRGSVITDLTVSWRVSDQSVATIDPSTGRVTGLKEGSTSVRAEVQGVAGAASLTVDPMPSWIGIVAGDQQVGPPGEPLTVRPEVEVRDEGGSPLKGVRVVFSVVEGGGSVGSISVTNSSGRASTPWFLGPGGPQRMRAEVEGGIGIEFQATSDPDIVVVVTPSLLNAFMTVAYGDQLKARGGTEPYTWSVTEGSIPPGMVLSTDGRLAGDPEAEGLFLFTVRAQPAAGSAGIRDLELRVCAAPPALAPGSVLELDPQPPGECGLFVPSGDGHRYRVSVIRWDVDSEPEPADVVTSVLTTTFHPMASSQPAEIGPRGTFGSPVRGRGADPEFSHQELAKWGFDQSVRLAEKRLLRRYGSSLRVLPSRSLPGPALASAPARFQYDPPRDLGSCTDHQDRTAVLVAQNDRVAMYQDSLQRESQPLDEGAVDRLLGFYQAYGHGAVTDYTGGLPDVNGDGLLVVLATPDKPGTANALVWSGDLYDVETCPGSNEMEIAYFDAGMINELAMEGSDYRAAATLVHEAKHVASFYHRLRNYARTQIDDPYHPPWVEEGTAEIVAEVASRRAWAEAGGPGLAEAVTGEHLAHTGRTQETAQIFLSLERAYRYLSRQPNAVTVAPTGADPTFGIYGSGWMFHRYLADAYYDPESEASFFREQNDSLTQPGVAGLEAITGKTFPDLLRGYAAALMLNGTTVPTTRPGFESYDFPSAMMEGVEGDSFGFPWPVTNPTGGPASFASHTYSGPLGESGVRIHDFASDGTGSGMEVHLEVAGHVSLVVVRLR